MGRQKGQDFGALLQVWKLPFVNASAIASQQKPGKLLENKKEEVKHDCDCRIPSRLRALIFF